MSRGILIHLNGPRPSERPCVSARPFQARSQVWPAGPLPLSFQGASSGEEGPIGFRADLTSPRYYHIIILIMIEHHINYHRLLLFP